MAYESGEAQYLAGYAAAQAGAALIWSPWAFYVALMMGTLISDPGQMSNSSHVWRTADNAGGTTELQTLTTDLNALHEELKTKAKWDGSALEQFEETLASFQKSVDSLKNVRNSTGEALDQSATLYFWGSVVCLAVGLSMFVFGLAKAAVRFTPWGGAIGPIEITESRWAVSMTKKVLIKHGIAVGTLGYLMVQAVQQSEQAGKLFPGTQAIPTEFSNMKSGGMPEFSDTTLKYDKTSGQIIPKMEDLTGKST